MNQTKPFWTIGRDWEKAHVAKLVKGTDQRALIFPVVDAALDINEGADSENDFVAAARKAIVEGHVGVWQNATNWIRKAASLRPAVNNLWDEISAHSSWKVRCRVACLLYGDIPVEQSDRLFAVLRHDVSTKVRSYAIDRYENRPGPDRNVVFKMFDAKDPASPGFSRGN